jgi:serine/threonine-protein kinase
MWQGLRVAFELPKSGDLIDGRFRVGLTLGSGSFGVVKTAVDEHSGEPVALKMLRPAAFEDPELVARFMREAHICEVLTHPNTVRLIHFGHLPQPDPDPDIPYMVLELVRGLPLNGLVKLRGSLTVVETSHVLARVLDSLSDAHMNGVVHRDLKPANILVAAPKDRWSDPAEGNDLFVRLGIPGRDDPVWQDLSELDVKVVDFGLGKLLEIGDRQVKRLTQVGVGAGTAEYMSPEQVRGERDIDHRADIYGVAMLIYRLLTGKPCFEGNTTFDLAVKHITDPAPELPGELADHPLAAIYRKASAKDRNDRYATVDEMAWELRGAVDDDYEALQALMAEGMASKPEFEAPPEARKPSEPDPATAPLGDAAQGGDAGAAQGEDAGEGGPGTRKSFLSRLFGK